MQAHYNVSCACAALVRERVPARPEDQERTITVSPPPLCKHIHTAHSIRAIRAILMLNPVLLTLTSCSMLPLGGGTVPPPSSSATPASSLTLYVGLDAAVHTGAFFALRADDGGLR